MEVLAKEFGDIASFFNVWVREAHPGGTYPQPATLDDRRDQARSFVAADRPAIPVLLDNMEGSLQQLLGGFPNSVYVIDTRGLVAYRATWTDAREVRRVLEHQREIMLRISGGKDLGIARWSEEIAPALAQDPDHYPVMSIQVWEQAENYGEPERVFGPERAEAYRSTYERATGRRSVRPPSTS